MIILQTFVVGLIVGLVVAILHLPIPAPPTFAGVAGIIGITAGYLLVSHVLRV